jgi:hypothetical protein
MAFAALAAGAPSLTAHEALSGVFGSISLASWIFLLVSIALYWSREQSYYVLQYLLFTARSALKLPLWYEQCICSIQISCIYS